MSSLWRHSSNSNSFFRMFSFLVGLEVKCVQASIGVSISRVCVPPFPTQPCCSVCRHLSCVFCSALQEQLCWAKKHVNCVRTGTARDGLYLWAEELLTAEVLLVWWFWREGLLGFWLVGCVRFFEITFHWIIHFPPTFTFRSPVGKASFCIHADHMALVLCSFSLLIILNY